MAITKKSIEMLDGTINVSSTEGVGSEFYAYIIDWLMPDMNGVELMNYNKSKKNKYVGGLIFSMRDSKILNKRQSKKAIAIYYKKIDIRKKSGCRRLRGI